MTCANAVTGQASGATPSTEPARDFVTFVPDGATCPIVADVGIDLPGGTNVEGHLRWPVPATPTTFGTDITWAQSVPTLAGTHRLNATVRDASGNPLAGMIVSAASTSLVGTSLVNASYSTTATTDSAGIISMILADGTYDVVIIRASP